MDYITLEATDSHLNQIQSNLSQKNVGVESWAKTYTINDRLGTATRMSAALSPKI